MVYYERLLRFFSDGRVRRLCLVSLWHCFCGINVSLDYRIAPKKMKPSRQRRLAFIIFLILSVSLALALALFALNQNINLFFTPSQVFAGDAPKNHLFRIGGIVKTGSVHHENGLNVEFILKDAHHQIPVAYDGILPALFREGQDIIVEGKLNNSNLFVASQVLAKHGETYAPRTR